jgi:modulator of FtsH protease HflC
MKRNPITWITGGVLVLIFALMLFTFQVRQTHVAVVTTFGKFSRSVTEPGFQLRLPWPIQDVYQFDNRVQVFDKKYEQTLTRDAINILITVYAGWRVADPRLFLESFSGDTLRAENALEPLVRNEQNLVVGRHDFSELISTNLNELKFDQIEQEMLAGIRDRARTNYGIDIQFVGIKQLGLPEGISTQVFERMRQERQTKVKTFEGEGQTEAQTIRTGADKEAAGILDQARAKAIEISGAAEATAAESYKILQQNPDLASFLFQRKALEALKERTTIIVDQNTMPFNLMRQSTTTNATRMK